MIKKAQSYDDLEIYGIAKELAREVHRMTLAELPKFEMYEEAASKKISQKEDMRPEYDFSSMKGGVRGKYYKAYLTGHKVEIHQAAGTTLVQYFRLRERAVMLEPDIRKYFPNSESVNKALRSLIAIIPLRRRISAHNK